MENDRLKQLVEDLASRVNGEVEESLGVLILNVEAPYILETLREVKGFPEVPCDFLHDLCGLDQGNNFAVVYQLSSLRGPQLLRVKAKVDRENPVIDSVVEIWPGADFLEREAFDMFGIQFAGHPNLKRIYLWDDFEGYPLRKNYVTESVEVRGILREYREGE